MAGTGFLSESVPLYDSYHLVLVVPVLTSFHGGSAPMVVNCTSLQPRGLDKLCIASPHTLFFPKYENQWLLRTLDLIGSHLCEEGTPWCISMSFCTIQLSFLFVAYFYPIWAQLRSVYYS